ncbi:hypothetical protein M1O18_05100 [Dehalococcoidia bacterium]|nr:hypothetical protein [Dehalococcoidia bacterium]
MQLWDKLENYLKANYVYDFDANRAPEGWEPNDWFLFEGKRGCCANYNSAFVVLSRSVGIPARLVAGFYITPQMEKQRVYADQTHVWSEVKFKGGVGWYAFDATGSHPDRLPTITKITSVSPVVKKGHSFNIQGTVQTEDGSPLDGQWVKVFLNSQKETEGGLLIGEGITSKGYFDIEAIISAEEDVGDYRVLAYYIGSLQYQESWSNHIIKVVTATNLSLQVEPSRVKVQEPIIIKGNLSEEFGRPLVGQPIDIYLADKKVAELITVEDGHFEWEEVLNDAGAYTVKASFAGTDYYLESSQEVVFQVLTPTDIKLDVISSDDAAGATVGGQVLIVGSLFETITDMPLPGHEIEILIDGESVGDTITTDEEGSFEVEHTFDEVGHYQIEARFSSIPFYWESSTKTELEVFPAPGGFPWSYLIIVLTLALAGIAGFFIYWRQKQCRLLLAPIAVQATAETQATPLPQIEKPGREVSLNIEFPQIKSPFPDVWGLDNDLEIVCRLTSPQGDRLADRPLEVYIGSELIAQLTTDKSGTAQLHYTFAEKGQHELLVRLREEPGIKDISARRTLRIVDYREEIVNLFKMLVKWLRDLGIELSMESTPREIEYQALNAGKGIPEGELDKVISCFEETDYSLHTIKRSNYRVMYLAQKEIREHGGKLPGKLST